MVVKQSTIDGADMAAWFDDLGAHGWLVNGERIGLEVSGHTYSFAAESWRVLSDGDICHIDWDPELFDLLNEM